MKDPFLFLLLFLVLSVSCSSTKEANEGEEEKEGAEEQEAAPKVRILDDEELPEGSDPFSYKELEMDGDILRLIVSYSGGCEEHRFELFSKGHYSKSAPPSVDLHLFHDANGDACRSVIEDTLRFDVSLLKHEDSDKLLLDLNEYDRSVEYAY